MRVGWPATEKKVGGGFTGKPGATVDRRQPRLEQGGALRRRENGSVRGRREEGGYGRRWRRGHSTEQQGRQTEIEDEEDGG